MIKNINKEEINLFQIIFLVLLLFGFELVSFLPDLLQQESRNISIVFRAIFLIVTLIVIFKNKVYTTKQHYYLIVFGILYFARMSYETIFFGYKLNIQQLDLWTFAVFLCVFPSIATSTFYNKQTLLTAKKWTYIVLILINIFGLLNNSLFLKENEYLERADANTVLNTISFGRTSAALIFMSLLYIRNKGFKSNLFYISFFILGLINIMISASRGPLLQLIIALICYSIINYKNIKLSYVFIFIICLVAFVTYFPEYNIIYKVLFERISNTGFVKNDSDITRYQLLESGWNQFLESPFFGDSLETNFLGAYPHNLVVEALMATGIIGGILMVILFVKSFISASKLQNNKQLDWLGGILIMQIIGSFSGGSLISSIILWPLMGMFFNYWYNYNFKNTEV